MTCSAPCCVATETVIRENWLLRRKRKRQRQNRKGREWKEGKGKEKKGLRGCVLRVRRSAWKRKTKVKKMK